MFEIVKSWWYQLLGIKHDNHLDLSPDLEIPNDHSLLLEDDELFVENFTNNGGRFFYCESINDVNDQLKNISDLEGGNSFLCFDNELKHILKSINLPYHDSFFKYGVKEIALLKCEYLLAKDGSLMVCSRQMPQKQVTQLPTSYIFIAHPHQIVKDLGVAMQELMKKYKGKIPTNISNVKKDLNEDIGQTNPDEIYLLLVENLQ